MPWNIIDDGGSGYGIGIAVALTSGEIEEFRSHDEIIYIAQKWSMEDLRDKSDGEVSVGYFAQNGKWISVAIFPAKSYSFVKVIMSESKNVAATDKPKRKKKSCEKGCIVFEDELELHNKEIHEPVICRICRYTVYGTKMLEIHMSRAPNHETT